MARAPLTRATGVVIVLSGAAMFSDFYLVVRDGLNAGGTGFERLAFEVPNALGAVEGPLLYVSLAAAALMIAGVRAGAVLYLLGQLLGSALLFGAADKFDQPILSAALSTAFGVLALIVVAKEWRVLDWVRPSMLTSRIEGPKNAHG